MKNYTGFAFLGLAGIFTGIAAAYAVYELAFSLGLTNAAIIFSIAALFGGFLLFNAAIGKLNEIAIYGNGYARVIAAFVQIILAGYAPAMATSQIFASTDFTPFRFVACLFAAIFAYKIWDALRTAI